MSDKETDDDKNQRKVVINSRRPGNVVINGRTAVHAGSGGVLTTSDVCKTPSKCRPRNYTNVAVSEDAAKTASSVFINGNPACHSQSIFSKSTGDEPGTCGGVKSGTIKQKAEFVTYSNNVFIEGFPAVRQFDLMVSNNRNTPPAPLMQPGAGTPPDLSPEGTEGVPLTPESHIVDLDTAGEELNLLKGQYSVLDPNQPTVSPDNTATQTTTAGQALSAQPAPSFTPTPRSTLPLPTHVHGGGWTPANQPHYQGAQPDAPSPWQKLAAFSIRAASIITGVLTTDDSRTPVKPWSEGPYRYVHDAPANQLQVYQGKEPIRTYRVEHNDIFTDGQSGTLVLPDTGEVVASVDEDGNVTPVSEQEDIAYRTYQANGGNEGFIAWQSAGRPTEGVKVSNTGTPIPKVNVSDNFSVTRFKDGSIDLDYLNPDNGHGLLVNVDSKGVLGFEIRAEGDTTLLGSGTDMFSSAMLRLEQEGVKVNAIRGAWERDSDSVNTAEYLQNIKNGMPPEEAAANTWTGRIAARYGYTKSNTPKMSTLSDTTLVIFSKGN